MRAGTRQVVRFAAIGAIGFVVDGGLMTALSAHASLDPMQARPFSFAAAVTVTWQLNRMYTFCDPGVATLSQWARYAAVNGAGALINLAVFYVLMLWVPALRSAPLLALAIAAGAALVGNYVGAKHLVFGRRRAYAFPGARGASARGGDDHGR